MEDAMSGAERGPIAARKRQRDIIEEIAVFSDEYGSILARYHKYTMDDLIRIEDECRRLQDEARSREAWGIADELATLEYLIDRAKAMKEKRIESERLSG
ncbi:MAG: hypothetical protein WC993_01650 [Methanoculleus sp.]